MEKWFSPEHTSRLTQRPVEYELCLSLGWLTKLRWLAGLGVIAASWGAQLILPLDLPLWPLTIVGLGILAYNLLFRWWLHRLTCDLSGANKAAHTQARLQIAADWLAMTLLIHYSGGVESPAILYFFFHIILSTILLSAREAYLFAVVAAVLVGGVALLEYAGILPHVSVGGFLPVSLYDHALYVGGVLFFFISTALVSVYLATQTTSHLRQREAEIVGMGRDLRDAYKRLHTLYESAQVVSSTLDLQQVLDRLTRSTTEVMHVKACTLRLLEEDGQTLCLASTYGLSEAYLQKGCLLVDQNPLVRQVLAGELVAVDDVTTDERLQYPAEATAEGICATLTAPLPGHKGPLGVIRVYCDEVRCFEEEDMQFLATVASHGSIAIENAMAYETLQNLDAAKRKFILTVTHELRAPVGVVRSLLRTLTGGYAGDLSELQLDMMNRALRRADFLQTLIDDLLDLAAGKAGLRVDEKLEAVVLNDVLAEVIERYRVPAAEKNIAVQVHIADKPLVVSSVTAHIDRAFTNLISNAVKYTPEHGQVTVTLHKVEGTAQLEVADSGIGIPEAALPHLFEEFYRAPNAKAQVKQGTGLGLVITKDIVTRYGGHIRVKSEEGKGTTFTLTLPLTE